jgi:chloramphenicol 3-O phosphotransferase
VATQVIVLNGGSSSGKSGIARCLQAVLPDPWLVFGVDTLIQAMPVSSRMSPSGIEFVSDGKVVVGPEFRTLEAAWIKGIAAIVYDLQVDTTHTEALECARAIAARVQRRATPGAT